MTETTPVVATKRAAIKRTPRPRNRKAQIIRAASDLFTRKGYAAVSAEEIASSVGITAGALYRHFAGKQDLLVHALIDALDDASAAVQRTPAADLDGVLRALAEVAVANREIGLLWTREIRLLDDEHRGVVRRHFFAVFRVVQQRLAGARPDLRRAEVELLSWTVFAVLTSVGYHATAITPQVLELLHELVTKVCATPLVNRGRAPRVEAPRRLMPQSRRELILISAAELFHECGYAGTSMAEIGEAAGVTGAGVYRHFAAKVDILSTLLTRAIGALQLQLADSLMAATDERDALARFIDDYTGFALRHPAFIGTLLTETIELGAEDLQAIRRAQREYLAEWEHLLQRLDPALSSADARVMVLAVITVVNDATRTSQLRARAALQENLGRIGRVMLGIDVPPHRS